MCLCHKACWNKLCKIKRLLVRWKLLYYSHLICWQMAQHYISCRLCCTVWHDLIFYLFYFRLLSQQRTKWPQFFSTLSIHESLISRHLFVCYIISLALYESLWLSFICMWTPHLNLRLRPWQSTIGFILTPDRLKTTSLWNSCLYNTYMYQNNWVDCVTIHTPLSKLQVWSLIFSR